MATSKWTQSTSEENIFTTELNSLASGSRKITTAAKSNDALDELYFYANFRIYLATQGTARSAGANIALYILPDVGGNYPYGGDSLDPPSELMVHQFSFDATVTARTNTITNILLPNTDFHILVKNNTGQALASSGNILAWEKHTVQSTS